MDAKNNKVTLMLIDEDSTRSYQVNRIFVKYNSTVILGTILLLVILTFSLTFIVGKYMVEQYASEHMVVKVSELEQGINDEIIAKSAEIDVRLEQLANSEASINKVLNYLKTKGIKDLPDMNNKKSVGSLGKKVSNAGGPAYEIGVSVLDDEQYSENIEKLLSILKETPIGYPHRGVITSGFGYRGNPITGAPTRELHSGLDLRGKIGDPVAVSAHGVVEFAGMQRGYGNVVKVRHGNGYSTVYAHLSKIKVKNGEKVKSGHIIGLVGNTGRSSGPHLHYEVRLNNVPLNPIKFLTLN